MLGMMRLYRLYCCRSLVTCGGTNRARKLLPNSSALAASIDEIRAACTHRPFRPGSTRPSICAKPRLAPKPMDGQCQPAPSQYLNSMKSNLYLQERPRQRRSKTPSKSQNSPRILRAPTLNRPSSGSRTAKLLDRLDHLSQTREHLHRTPISTPAYHRLPEIPRYVFVGDQPGESEPPTRARRVFFRRAQQSSVL